MVTLKARLGLTPDYITELLTPYEPECSLRSSSRELLDQRSGENKPLDSDGDQAGSLCLLLKLFKIIVFRMACSWVAFSFFFYLCFRRVILSGLLQFIIYLLFILLLFLCRAVCHLFLKSAISIKNDNNNNNNSYSGPILITDIWNWYSF